MTIPNLGEMFVVRTMEKSHRINIRVSEKDKNKIKMLALTYAAGNISEWLTYAALNVDAKFLVPTNARAQRKKSSRPKSV